METNTMQTLAHEDEGSCALLRRQNFLKDTFTKDTHKAQSFEDDT